MSYNVFNKLTQRTWDEFVGGLEINMVKIK